MSRKFKMLDICQGRDQNGNMWTDMRTYGRVMDDGFKR